MKDDRQLDLLADEQALVDDQLAIAGHGAGRVVLDRQHAELGLAGEHRVGDRFEGRPVDPLEIGQELAAGLVRIGARLALISDDTLHHASPIRAPSEAISRAKPGKLVPIMSGLVDRDRRRLARPSTRKLIAMR